MNELTKIETLDYRLLLLYYKKHMRYWRHSRFQYHTSSIEWMKWLQLVLIDQKSSMKCIAEFQRVIDTFRACIYYKEPTLRLKMIPLDREYRLST